MRANRTSWAGTSLNSDGAKGKDREASEAIDATLCGVDIFRKDIKRTKAVGQSTNYGGVGVTEGAATGLSAVSQQYNVVFSVAACVLHAASRY